MSDKDVLISMGFDSARVEWALRATNNKGLQPAMDFILEHNDDPIPDASTGTTATSSTQHPGDPMDEGDDEDAAALRAAYGIQPDTASQPGSGADLEARYGYVQSIRCSECGKIFKNTALANFHAEKSGHDQFEESTEEKLAEKRAMKVAEETSDAKANELIRRKAGKDAAQTKEDLKNKQILKDLEARRRVDKRERARKAAEEKALREGRAPAPPVVAGTSAPSAAAPATTSIPGREFKETRLQIRLASGGQPLTTTLPSDAPLREVAEFVAGQSLTVDVDTVTFTQHFPRKQFSPSDFSRSLRDLGLTPSAVLIAS
ncbi:ubiquitin-related domain-containing protein [Multifurca ochricompacta]|uniref:Ubiquitin-related domain-containing protein n=1 Tax=Multifurca ochricompacta TaxID=376703 RepID=A0AAD4QJ25_9AGAM|nr:ubiquitin-related domain-containing protein [Multifurca ochricompacta]